MTRLLILLTLLSTLTNSSYAIYISKARVHIRENHERAQLSIILQIGQIHRVPEQLGLNKALVQLMKTALKNGLEQNDRLQYHDEFSHIFITAINKSSDEEILALFTKTPENRYPSIQFFHSDLAESPLAAIRKRPPPSDLFDQLDEAEQTAAVGSFLDQ